MPYCSHCGEPFRGRGSRCALHNSHAPHVRFYENNYSSDSSDAARVRLATQRRHDRSSPYVDARHYDPHLHRHSLVRYGHPDRTGRDLNAVTQPLVHAFGDLSPNHEIATLSYAVDRAGGQSLTAAVNFDREQCTVCYRWFPDQHKLNSHKWDFPLGCEEHQMCLREEDVQYHATSERHHRCFIRGCEAEYRKEGGWKESVIKAHMRHYHY